MGFRCAAGALGGAAAGARSSNRSTDSIESGAMSTSKTICVLIVDDSAVVRQVLDDVIRATPGMEVAGTASDGQEALEMIAALKPDVVTLDVQMPRMDGLTTLDALLRSNPIPVVMVSSLTRIGADITLEALDHGAVDYVAKPEPGQDMASALGDELIRKIRSAAGVDVRRILEIRRQRKLRQAQRRAVRPSEKPPTAATAPGELAELVDKCIAIGISTGGPPVLAMLFEALQPPMPPIVVVQHMPPHFTGSLAWRLDSLSALSVREAQEGDMLAPNLVLIAPGGKHLKLRRAGRTAKVALDDGPPVSGHKPSVDVMMTTAASMFGPRTLGIVMTGMGRDGSDGCKAIRAAGGYVLGQDEQTSAVYGMNKVAWVEGNVDRQFALHEGARMITQFVVQRFLNAALTR